MKTFIRSRLKNLAMVFTLLFSATSAFAATFTDVPRTHWAYDAIEEMVAQGALVPYGGKFHGERVLSRYQMAVIVNKILIKANSKDIPPPPKPSWDNYKLEKLQVTMKDLRTELNKAKERLNKVEVSVDEIKRMDK